jgi:hypothetical protein
MKLINNVYHILNSGAYGLLSQRKLNYILSKKQWIGIDHRPYFLPTKTTIRKFKKQNNIKAIQKWNLI